MDPIEPTQVMPRRSSTEMYPLVESYLGSTLGRAAFCKEAGISPAVFAYWYSKYHKSKSKASGRNFVPLHLSGSGAPVLVVKLSGCELRFMSYPDVGYLQALLAGS